MGGYHMDTMKTLCHGSTAKIEKPLFGAGNVHNDYGLGFYCTEDIELAKEWACIHEDGGWANIYTLETKDLSVMNLSSDEYSILHWLSVLVNNRTFNINTSIAAEAKEFLTEFFLPDTSRFDAIIGYRADDSYFTFAQDFLSNTISLRQLGRAMTFGSLGKQFVLKSAKAFELLRFTGTESADGSIYFSLRTKRDREAREQYLKRERRTGRTADDLFMIDILRQEMKHGDARLQGKLSE
jgi:hypothetical protein